MRTLSLPSMVHNLPSTFCSLAILIHCLGMNELKMKANNKSFLRLPQTCWKNEKTSSFIM